MTADSLYMEYYGETVNSLDSSCQPCSYRSSLRGDWSRNFPVFAIAKHLLRKKLTFDRIETELWLIYLVELVVTIKLRIVRCI